MQVALLRDSIHDFHIALSKGWSSGLEPLYQTIPVWQQTWPPASPHQLAETIEVALTNTKSRSFWQGHAYYPKEVIQTMSRKMPEMVNLAFGRLFNLDMELGPRFSQFIFYLDECLDELRRNDLKTAPPTHYHADYRMPSLYCLLRYPEDHGYFESDLYNKALHALNAPNISGVADASRFYKSTKAIKAFMAKEGLEKAHLARLDQSDFREPCALLVSEYFRFLTR